MSDPADTKPAATEEKKEAPFAAVFGSGSAFGAGSGFAGFTGVAPAAARQDNEGADGGEEETGPEEECQAEFKPIVQLEEVETTTGEEQETALIELKCKLYRFDAPSNEWKERGIGIVKLLQHKDNKKVRLLMRQEKTLKIRANHIVMPNTKLQEHSGNDKAWVWSTVDFADEEQKSELFCMRFGTVEKAQEFKTKFEEAMDINEALIADTAASPAKAAAGEEEEEEAAAPVETKEDAADKLAVKVQEAVKVE